METDCTGKGRFTAWMAQADPLALPVTEVREHGLKILADAGNGLQLHGNAERDRYTEGFAFTKPEYLWKYRPNLFDYREKAVQDYLTSAVR